MTTNKICISKLSGKLSNVTAISTNPFENDFCNHQAENKNTTCSICYARRYLSTFRQNAISAYSRNTKMLSEREITPEDFPKNSFFIGQHVRFLAYGELTNDIMFKNFCKIAEMHPYITATMWTKRLDIVKPLLHLVPKNLRLIYSTLNINPDNTVAKTIPDGFSGVFNVYSVDYAKEHNIDINCSGSCATCLRCYTGEGTVTNELIKEKWGDENYRYDDVKNGKKQVSH